MFPAPYRSTLTRIAISLAILTSGSVIQAPARAQVSQERAQAGAVAAVKPALVRILVAEATYGEGREDKAESSGSGVIISADGYVVTNHHVAGQAKRLVCTLSNREVVEADLVGTDALTDISVIKLRPNASGPYPFARWGDSAKLEVGDRVLAMGSPMALSQSVTLGIVSNAELVLPEYMSGGMTLNGEDVGSIVRWIGHDASISPGNSGGPLVNEQGEVIGINEISLGLAGAIPGNLARAVAEEIIKSGKVTRAWLGVNPQALLKGSKMERGVLVGGVLPDSPAKAAGLKSGDILVRLAGQDVSVRFAEQMPQFNQMIASLPIGKPVEAVLLRGGQEVTIQITPSERHQAEPRPCEVKAWGVCVSGISPITRLERKRPTADGVLVYSVRPGGPAGVARPPVAGGDIIVEVNGQPVKTCEDFLRLAASLAKPGLEENPVLVTLEHESERVVTVLDIGEKDEEERSREVSKAFLPVATQVVTAPLAKALKVEGRKGFRITRVDPGSSAATAGLLVGDIIVSVDGEPFEVSQPEENDVLSDLIRQYKIGASVKLGILRDAAPKVVPVVLETAPLATREMERYKDKDFEFSVRDLSWQDKADQKLAKSAPGALVEEVAQGGWAALGRLSSGDIILAVDGAAVANVKALKEAMKNVREARAPRVVLHVQRGIQESFVEMESDWSGSK